VPEYAIIDLTMLQSMIDCAEHVATIKYKTAVSYRLGGSLKNVQPIDKKHTILLKI